MKITTASATGALRRLLRSESNLATLLIVVGTIASLAVILYFGVGVSRPVVPAARIDSLSAARTLEELDEAAFRVAWAQSQATPPAAITVEVGAGCHADCVIMIWPDGTTMNTDQTAALDYAGLCACPVAVRSH